MLHICRKNSKLTWIHNEFLPLPVAEFLPSPADAAACCCFRRRTAAAAADDEPGGGGGAALPTAIDGGEDGSS